MILHGDRESGNCYKVRLVLAHLGRSYDWVDVDILAGASRTPEFLEKNPNGRIPLLELDDGRCLAESNAILCYLAEGSRLLPSESFERALVLQWLFFEQYSHEPFIATSRYWIHYLDGRESHAAELAEKRDGGLQALAVMNGHLEGREFFVGNRLTVADIALYAYTHVADEGDFDLAPYPAVLAWLERVAGAEGHQPMRDRETR